MYGTGIEGSRSSKAASIVDLVLPTGVPNVHKFVKQIRETGPALCQRTGCNDHVWGSYAHFLKEFIFIYEHVYIFKNIRDTESNGSPTACSEAQFPTVTMACLVTSRQSSKTLSLM